MRLLDRRGNPVDLGRELGRGGEGAVFDAPTRQGSVAKVYHQAPDALRARKVLAMADLATPRLSALAAWPTESLHGPKGEVLGFLMPKVQGFKDVHLLYGPKSRLREFPSAGWPFLVRAATNLSRAFAAVHDHGHVIGDVNDKLAMVSDKATVMLVDCDSFQVRHQGTLFTCDVGVPTHQPPEFQHLTTFRSLERTHHHDAFGLAVLVFQLLFMARHPFSGAFLGAGEMPIERAIREFRFVYGAGAAANQMRPPPHALTLAASGGRIGQLFERAFANAAPTSGRPFARDWADALEDLERSIRSCTRNSNHAFHPNAGDCPFCAIESRVRIVLFGYPSSSGSGVAADDVAAIWAEITRVAAPSMFVTLPTVGQPLAPSELARRVAEARKTRTQWRNLLTVVVGLLVLGTLVFPPFLVVAVVTWFLFRGVTSVENHPAHQEAQRNLNAADERWKQVVRNWEQHTSGSAFEARRQELVRLKAEIDALSVEQARRIQQLDHDRRVDQLDAFLDAHRLAKTPIPGIGPGRKVALESYGVETAKDVSQNAVGQVPGFGPGLTRKLLDWRQSIESRFQFDPARPIDPVALAALQQEMNARRSRLAGALAAGPGHLRAIALEIDQRQRATVAIAIDASQKLSRATADAAGNA